MYSKILVSLCVFFLALNLVFASEKDILNISSKNVVAMEVSTGRVLFSKKHMEKTLIQSTHCYKISIPPTSKSILPQLYTEAS